MTKSAIANPSYEDLREAVVTCLKDDKLFPQLAAVEDPIRVVFKNSMSEAMEKVILYAVLADHYPDAYHVVVRGFRNLKNTGLVG